MIEWNKIMCRISCNISISFDGVDANDKSQNVDTKKPVVFTDNETNNMYKGYNSNNMK